MSRARVVGVVFSGLALASLAMYEGFRDKAYDDGVGVKTIGFGSTEGVKAGDRITVERGLVLLSKDVAKHEAGLRACVGDVPMYQHEWDAFVSLTFNVGVGAVCGSSIVPKLKAGDYAAACKTILDFDGFRDRSKPKVLNARTGKMEYPITRIRGLTIRRQAEYKTCIGAAK